MSAYTPKQRQTLDIALAILRRGEHTQYDVRRMTPPTRAHIAEQVAGYDADVIGRIASAYQDVEVRLEADLFRQRPCGEWNLAIAIEVITRVIWEICGTSPLYGPRPETDWIFVGRTLIDEDDRCDFVLPTGRTVKVEDLVDLWVSKSGETAMAVLASEDVDVRVGHRTGGLGQGCNYIREAFRRFKVESQTRPSLVNAA